MAIPLTFSSMTWDILEEKYGIVPRLGTSLFENPKLVQPSVALVENIRRGRRSRLVNERAKAQRLVDPVLSELENSYFGKIATIPEVSLEVKDVEGLSGTPDFVISASTTIKMLPIIAIVEAKKDDMDAAMPQCAAELHAANVLNKGRPRQVYGCVTIGTDWKFLCLRGEDKRLLVDTDFYFIDDLAKLLGVLSHIVDVSLADLEANPV